tara:strand:- start:29 stop:334 length:306 start_codon:yes stop_codon:yes gene_type:complete
MITAPDAVYIIIPCMKELGMSWSDIKATPRHELVGLLAAMSNYNIMHSFDGYTPDEIGDLAKNKPQIRSDYNKSIALKKSYEARSGKKEEVKSFKQLFSIE